MTVSQDEALSRIGPYEILRRLGSGGMGEVFLARDDRLDRLVAIKRIAFDRSPSPRDRERLRREARLVAQLNHPAVVQIYDVLEEDDRDAIVMEYVEGPDLRHWLAGRPLAWERAVALGEEIARGLGEAHRKNIIHRDLKTENVLVTSSGHAKITDFGLGRQLFADEKAAIESGDKLVGTCRAMSPEQVRGEELSPLSDLFSLGTLLYEVTTGGSPFGDSGLPTLRGIASTTQRPASEAHPQVPAELSQLIDQLLQKDPARRPQSADEVADRLRDLAPPVPPTPLGSGAFPTSAWRTAAQPSGSWQGSGSWGNGPLSREISVDLSLKTLVLTDLVESTDLIEQIGEARASETSIRHDRMARDLVAHHQGREIDKSDGFLLLFDRPRDAVAWALAYHEELRLLSAELGVGIRARIGIHVGEIYLRENEPLDVARGAKPLEIEGLAKPLAARVMSLAKGGQTLLTQAAFELVRRALDEMAGSGVRWVSHGSYHFKGVKEPVRIFEVGDAEHAPFTAPRDTEKARQRRRRLLPAVAALVLAVLVGGGYFLRETASEGEMRTAVAVLGFKDLSRGAGGAWLSTALAELLSTELAAGGQLRLIPGESVARMKLDLSLLETDSLSPETLEAIGRNLGSDYVVLGWYLLIDQEDERQLTIQPVLQQTATGQTLVGERLTGLESELLSLVTRVGTGLRGTLGVGDLSAPQFEAVEATLSSSPVASQLYFEGLEKLRRYDALAARDVLEKAVAADPGYALAHAALSRAWSALGHDDQAAQSARRAFELRRGLPREDVLLIEGRYYESSNQLQQAIRSYQALWSFYPDNLEYGLQLARVQEYAGHVPEALATLNALRQLPEPSGSDPRIDLAEAQVAFAVADYPRELTLAEKALQRGEEQNARILMAEALFRRGRTLSMLGELEEAAGALEASRYLFAEVGDRVSAARAMNAYAVQLWEQGEFERSEEIYRAALSLLEDTGNKSWLSTLLNNHATLILERGDLETAESMLEESLEIVREIKDPGREAERLANLAWVALEQGELAPAREQARQALAIAESIDSRQKTGEISYLIARIDLAGGRWHQAREQCEKALAVFEELGSRRFAAQARNLLGEILLAGNALNEALDQLQQAEAIRAELHERGNLALTRLARAAVLLELDRPTEAEALARTATAEFVREGRTDDELLAGTLSARALLAQDRTDAAQELLAQLEERAARSQSPRVRLTVAVAVGLGEAAAGAERTALRRLQDAGDEAARLGLIGVAFEARLARGRIGLSAGQAGARDDLEALSEEARQRGLTLIAEKAAAEVRGPG